MLEGDELKQGFRPAVQRHVRDPDVRVLVLNRNFPPNSWQACARKVAQASENLPSAMRRSVRFVAVLPTVMHTVGVSEGGGGTITDTEEPGLGGSRGKEGSLQEDFLPLARPRSDPGQGGIRGKDDAGSDPDSAHPFALVELAVCMHGVLRRRGHLTHLDGVQSSETSKVVSIFYRYYAGAHGRQQLRRLLEHELPCQVIGVPWLQPGAAAVFNCDVKLAPVRAAVCAMAGRDYSACFTDEDEMAVRAAFARTEAQHFFAQARLPMDDMARDFVSQLGATIAQAVPADEAGGWHQGSTSVCSGGGG